MQLISTITRRHTCMQARREGGAGLIEVLIAVLILGFGILALAGMQAFAVAANQNVISQGIAASLAAEFADMMRANPDAFGSPTAGVGGQYDLAANFDGVTTVSAVSAGLVCAYPNCTTTTLAAYEIALMKNRLRASLRGGTYALSRPVVGLVSSPNQGDLWIMWTERRNSGTAATESNFDKCPAAVVSITSMPRCFYMRVTL